MLNFGPGEDQVEARNWNERIGAHPRPILTTRTNAEGRQGEGRNWTYAYRVKSPGTIKQAYPGPVGVAEGKLNL
jgi:hypothetical protein